jgi:hypothetical protein
VIFFAAFLAALAGVGIPEALKPHETAKPFAAAVVVGVTGAASATQEWTWVILGALVGALVGVLIEKFPVGASVRARGAVFVISLGTSTMVSMQIIDGFGWSHTQPLVLAVSFGVAFLAYPALVKARDRDWFGAIISKWIPDTNKKANDE